MKTIKEITMYHKSSVQLTRAYQYMNEQKNVIILNLSELTLLSIGL